MGDIDPRGYLDSNYPQSNIMAEQIGAKRKASEVIAANPRSPKSLRILNDDAVAETEDFQSSARPIEGDSAVSPSASASPSTSSSAPTSTSAPAPTSANTTTPWLTRPQNISEQNLWLLHCRDNLVPGSRGPKDWITVTEEFNTHFAAELKKGLAMKTLSKRLGIARQQFNIDNPEYVTALLNRASASAAGNLSDAAPESNVTQVDNAEEFPAAKPITNITAPKKTTGPAAAAISAHNVQVKNIKNVQESQAMQPSKLRPAVLRTSEDVEHAIDWRTSHPGTSSASLISPHQVSPIDRVKWHLCHRTQNRVIFAFVDKEDQDLVADDSQFIDHDILRAISPFWARQVDADSEHIIDVPKEYCIRTINAFIQLLSPVRSKFLPTHYLWRSPHLIPGAHDRFGAIAPEKIHWGVSNLLELSAFARYMEVDFICDMVVDRLHWMYITQAAHRSAADQQASSQRRLSSIADLECFGISAADVETAWLDALIEEKNINVPMLTFVADLVHALRGEIDAEWLRCAPVVVQNLFNQVGLYDWLEGASRAAFCNRYHQHNESEACYTANKEQPGQSLVDQLYSAPLVEHVPAEILEAEKMVLEMEMRMEQVKTALWKARLAGTDDRRSAMKVVEAVRGLYEPSELQNRGGGVD
ncbi:hypothetical protein ACEQ8H_005980 [Pleosporales sp. CAS-2024a]